MKSMRKSVRKSYKEICNLPDQGLRVLGFAYRILPDSYTKITLADEEELIFLGLVSLMDPPREESKAAVEHCLRAGITPVMITGDHKVTAVVLPKHWVFIRMAMYVLMAMN